MRISNTIRLSAALLIATSLTAPAFAAGEAIGVNAAVKGNVTIQSAEQTAKQAVVKAPVLLGDEVNSKKLSSLQVMLKDETVFTVGPDCTLTIDEFVYNPASNNNALSAKVSKGMFRFMSGKVSSTSPDNISIDTPVASMGVRGTIAEGAVGAIAVSVAQNAGVVPTGTQIDGQNASLFVLRGPGRKNKGKNRKGQIEITSGGSTVTVNRAGMAVFVPAQGATPIGPFELPNQAYELFADALGTTPTSRQNYRPLQLDASMQRTIRDLFDDAGIEYFDPQSDLDWPQDIDRNEDGDFNAICSVFSPNAMSDFCIQEEDVYDPEEPTSPIGDSGT